jgi:hypothetical protein
MGQSDRRIIGDPTPEGFGPADAIRFMLDQPGRVLSPDEIEEFVYGIAAACALFGVAFDIRFAQAMVETNNGRYGGQVQVGQKNIGGIGATDDGRPGLSNPTWERAGLVFVAHSLAWANDERGKASPRYGLVQEKARRTGFAATFRDLGNGRWATDPIYGDTIDGRYADIARGRAMATGKEVTDRHIASWTARGRWVVDNRGWLQLKTDRQGRPIQYGKIPLAGITYAIHHWTGDQFTRATIQKISGAGVVPGNTIPASLTWEQERAMVKWYHELHQGKGWPGIAYPFMVFPSGRIHVNWDIGTLSYHAFSVNGYSVATCCPNSNGQPPEPEQLVSINHVWYALFEETPEIPADWSHLLGHTEARILDAQNQTVCPGTAYLGHVKQARETGVPSVPIDVSGNPTTPTTPPTYDPVTNLYVGEELFGLYTTLGGWPFCGHPIAPMAVYNDGWLRQPFERMTLGHKDGLTKIESAGSALAMQTGSPYPVWGDIKPLL